MGLALQHLNKGKVSYQGQLTADTLIQIRMFDEMLYFIEKYPPKEVKCS
jgi:hypothetical protein